MKTPKYARWLAMFCALCGSVLTPAHAMDAATAAYLNARDKTITELKYVDPHLPDIELYQRDNAALLKLGVMMQRVIGPIELDGFPTSGEYNVRTLVQEVGFGMLDGVAVKSDHGQVSAVVSTELLLRIWLAQNSQDFRDPPKSGVMDIAGWFVSGEFYAMAMEYSEAAYYKYAELPLEQRGGMARAILFVRAQDDPAPALPDGVLVAVMRGGKVVLFKKALAAPVIPECSAAFARDSKKAEELDAADRDARNGGHANVPSVDRYEVASNTFIRCYAEHLPHTASYAALVSEAQALVDMVK